MGALGLGDLPKQNRQKRNARRNHAEKPTFHLTFPKWQVAYHEYCLILTAGQAFLAPSGVCGRASCWNRANHNAKLLCSGSGAVSFSAAGRPPLPLSFSLGMDHDYAHSGGALNRG
jgi:hypothetical protein